KCKCEVIVHTQGSTTNFATHLLSHEIVKPQLAINKANNSQLKIDVIFKKSTTNHINQIEAIYQALVEFIIEDSQLFYLLKTPFAEATTLLEGSTYSTISFMLLAIKVLLQNCKPKASDDKNYQIESESDNINFDDIITIFDEKEIIVDYDYNNKIEITIDAKEINVNKSIETKGLVYKKREQAIEAVRDL
ncbi:7447_t:CDS:2, partial [Racocetra persica]